VQGTIAPVSITAETAGEPFALQQLGPFGSAAQTQLVLFVFTTTLSGAVSLIEARRLGVTRRMIATPTTVRAVLLGEGLARLAIALIQGLFIMVGTMVIFGVDWGNPLRAIVILVVFSLVATGAAMLLGSLARNDQQAGGLATLFGLGLAALGGAMFPLAATEILSPVVWRVAHVTPHAWALEAFEALVVAKGGLTEVLPFLGILLAYALLFFALAICRLRVVLTR